VHGLRQEGGVSIEGAEEGGIQYDHLIKYFMDDCREIKDFIKKNVYICVFGIHAI
jgi:hypothetical protein